MDVLAYLGISTLLLCGYLCLYRVGSGPTVPDRTVAIDILGTLLVGFSALVCLYTGKGYYVNLAVAWALLSFIGTVALGKWLEGRGLDE
ncbi:MAG TPA: multiple resistance and pH regulation protein F [Planctomycetes bacterium]|nr:multiple resistance and pH regulation protein F [Planctomycetota bacterium]